jgi:hypothetical protein
VKSESDSSVDPEVAFGSNSKRCHIMHGAAMRPSAYLSQRPGYNCNQTHTSRQGRNFQKKAL